MSASCESLLQSRVRRGVLHLELNRGNKKNALDRELVLSLGKALRDLRDDDETRVVLLSGRDGAFCSGADLSTITGVLKEELSCRVDEFHEIIVGIAEAPQPVVALVDGPAVGFGADLALAADVRVMTPNAYLEQSFLRIGLVPDGGGSFWMPQHLGPRAFEAIALSERFDAEQCANLGLANHLRGHEESEEFALSLASRFAAQAPLALRALKKNLRGGDMERLRRALAREKEAQVRLLLSEDFQEGVAAFLEKREAHFRGR